MGGKMTKLRRLALVLLAVGSLFFVACGSTPKESSGSKSDSGASTQKTDRDSSGKNGSGKNGSGNGDNDGSGKNGSGKNGNGKDSYYFGDGDDSDDLSSIDENEDYQKTGNYNSLFKRIDNSRKKALKSGAGDDSISSDFFKALDHEYQLQKRLAEQNGPTPEMTNILKQINSAYLALEQYEDAKAKKQKIDKNGYASHSQKAYDEGASLLKELEAVMADSESFFKQVRTGTSDVGDKFYKKALKANTDFTNVFKATATDERTAAFKAKKQADSVKASVSRKSDYDDGVTQFRNGDSNYVTGSVEDSIDNYIRARKIFSTLYKEVAAAREAAQKKIEAAKKKVDHSRNTAAQTDKTDPLTEKIEGIEDHNAKLLDDDDFTEAANSYVEVDETLDLGGAR